MIYFGDFDKMCLVFNKTGNVINPFIHKILFFSGIFFIFFGIYVLLKEQGITKKLYNFIKK
jgi:hypothetical protein